MPCDACGCTCADGGGVVPMEVDDNERPPEKEQQREAAAVAGVGSNKPDDDLTTASPATTTDGMAEEKAPSVWSMLLDCFLRYVVVYVVDFVVDYQIPRVLSFLLWAYLLNWMRRFALTHTDGNIWFSTFDVIVMGIPLTEFFVINRMLYLGEEPPPPLPPAAGTREQLVAGLRYILTKPDDSITIETTQEKTGRCLLRGLMVLAWLFVIEFSRRALLVNEFGEFEVLSIPLVIWAVTTSSSFLVMGCLYVEGLLEQ